MLFRFIASLSAIVIILGSPRGAFPKCPTSRVDLHGTIIGAVPTNAVVAVSLVFRNGHKQPPPELVNLKGNTFNAVVNYSMQSRSGLIAEWGEKCDRTLKQVLIRLIDKEGHEIDKVTLNVNGDLLNTGSGFILRSPVTLHGRQ